MGRMGLAGALAGFVAAGLFVPAARAVGDDWPHFRGPAHDGLSRETGWLEGWPEGSKPRVAWRADVGSGHSAVTVSGGLACTMGWDGRQDTVFCFDAATGVLKWRASYSCEGRVQYPGPRATPTLDGGAAYTLSQRGHLRAWDLADGRLRWERRLPEACNPDDHYGHAWSPLVVGDLVILPAGRRGLALRKATGETAWGDDAGRATCASAVPYAAGGRTGVIVTNTDRETVTVVGVDARTGEELWRFGGWPEKYGAFCASPIFLADKVFITSGQEYHKGARLAIEGRGARKEWESRALGSNTGQCVLLGGHVYGVDCARRALVCVSWQTGEKVWEQKGFGAYGNLMAADGKLLIMTSDGHLVVAEAAPAAFRELRRAENVVGETFTAPVLANGRIYCRDWRGRVVCLATGRGP